MRRLFVGFVFVLVVASSIAIWFAPQLMWSWLLLGPVVAIGLYDYFQTKHSIPRNFPAIGRMRYLMEFVRPEIYQYFIESDTEGVPFDRDQRSIVYQRSKVVRDTVPFGTKEDVYRTGYEWVNHSMTPLDHHPEEKRVEIGGDRPLPYSASLLNISAMSFGSLSENAVLALSEGAKLGEFAHNTGEGGISPYHERGGGDLIWQIGTGYFGCRDDEGQFCEDLFAKNAAKSGVRMIELKLSQGAKPGHGGILPASKVTPEIAKIRNVPVGRDVLSPPGHRAFSNPIELLEFVNRLRDLSGGKPVGIKLCVGKRREFLALCKAMLATELLPDYIAVDGGEGGTGAAPLEFSNHLGAPLYEGLIFVHNALVGCALRDRIKIIASGKVSSGFTMLKLLSLGADSCYAARSMMMALGCIQALKCNSNHCPVGVATQDRSLMAGLAVSDKKVRVMNFHRETVKSFCEILGALGLEDPNDLRPWHVMHRISPTETRHYGELYQFLEEGALLQAVVPDDFRRAWEAAHAESFKHVDRS
ncbi:MAG: FMN-binding glutamate synthase family protein [Aureliella sp.]